MNFNRADFNCAMSSLRWAFAIAPQAPQLPKRPAEYNANDDDEFKHDDQA